MSCRRDMSATCPRHVQLRGVTQSVTHTSNGRLHRPTAEMVYVIASDVPPGTSATIGIAPRQPWPV
eukprot:scaffold77518_cov56-Cyclotella_meneghiniana.AAC.1